MTPQQYRTLKFIVDYTYANKLAPTYDEMSKELGFKKSGVHRIIHALNRKGYIIKAPGVRNIKLGLPAPTDNEVLKWAIKICLDAGFRFENKA